MAPEQPKTPVGGAFGVFFEDKRHEFTKACAGQKASEVSKMAGIEWKKLTDEQKPPYQKRFLEIKAKYDKDMKAFLAAGGTKEKGVRALRSQKAKAKQKLGKKMKKLGKKMKDANVPKKPAGGSYGEYFAENREEIGKALPKDHKITDLWKAVRAKWKSLADKDRKLYEGKYHKKMAEYHTNMAEYKENNGGAEAKDEEEKEK